MTTKQTSETPYISAELLKELDTTMTGLQQTIALYGQNQINLRPSEEGWSAGEVTGHILKADAGIVRMINAEARDAGRSPDEKVAGIKTTLLDFNIKMKAPDFILPDEKEYQKSKLIEQAEKVTTEFELAIKSHDLTKLCTSFEVPVVGKLTRWEAIYFAIYHTQRHTHQLKNILSNLNE